MCHHCRVQLSLSSSRVWLVPPSAHQDMVPLHCELRRLRVFPSTQGLQMCSNVEVSYVPSLGDSCKFGSVAM